MPADRHPHLVLSAVASDNRSPRRLANLLAAARDIAGEAWDSWWENKPGRVLAIGFELAEHAQAFQEWLSGLED